MSTPWLQKSHFEHILTRDVENYQNIKELTVTNGSGAGENYSSVMLRVEAQVERKNAPSKLCSYMLKLAPEKDSGIFEFIKNGKHFIKENLMYDQIIPGFEKLYFDKGHLVSFGPKNYHFKQDLEREAVITEDLRLEGFSNANRLEGLNKKQCNAVLEKLAKFHAASAVYYDEIGPYNEVFNINLFVDSSQSIFEEFNANIMASMEPCIKELCKNGEYFASKLFFEKDIKEYVKYLMESEKINYGEFNVLNHGDCWSNNILFKYNENKEIKETKFIDFQICKYGSPALDLYYFIISSARLELKVDEFDNFIDYYHQHLTENLELLEYRKPLPRLFDLKRSLLKHGIWARLALCGVLAAALLDPNEQANMDNFIKKDGEENNLKSIMYSNPRYIEALNILLPWLDSRGILDKEYDFPKCIRRKLRSPF